MTTYEGIAAVTQTLGYLVDSAIRQAVPEANVTLTRPEEPAAAAANDPRVNIYLVQVTPEATMRSNDLPTRTGNGNLLQAPQAPVNLRYLLSFFGSSQKAHLMLGATEIVLREHAVLEASLIRQALASHPALQGSGLEQQVPAVRIVPSTVTLEELSRFWSGFLQMPYTISTVYEATTVILTSTQVPGATLPVRGVRGGARGEQPPQLDALAPVQFASAGGHATIVPVSGERLAPGQQVRIAGRWRALQPRAAGGFQFTLPDDTEAGVQRVQLGEAGGDGETRPIAGSRPQTLQVRPDLRRLRIDRRAAAVIATVAPPVRAGQQAILSLISAAGAGDPAPSAQLRATVTESSAQLAFDLPPGLPTGPYLALLEVDGVTSLPVVRDGRYAAPTVELSR